MNRNFVKVSVKCYSGYTYAEEPRSFTLDNIEYKVIEIEKSWQEPGERHFRVRTDAHKLFQLCYNETHKQWWGGLLHPPATDSQ